MSEILQVVAQVSVLVLVLVAGIVGLVILGGIAGELGRRSQSNQQYDA